MLLKSHSLSQKGFTLIEALVSIAILGVMAAIFAPNFMVWLNNKKIEDTATSIEGALKEAQSTAIRRNITCYVLVTSTTVSAVLADGVTADTKCLPSGARQLQVSSMTRYSEYSKVSNVNINSNITLAGTGGNTGTIVTFSAIGTANFTPSTRAFVIYRSDLTSAGRQKCIVVSSGIGLIKSGTYTGTVPPALSSPPTQVEIDAVSQSCSVT